MNWRPVEPKQCTISLLRHLENQHPRSINNFWSCILGNQGIDRKFELISELLTALIVHSTNHNRKNIDSKIIHIATWRPLKPRLLDVEYAILIKRYYHTAKARALHETTDGPTGQPADTPPNQHVLGDSHRTVPEMRVPVNWRHWLPIWQWFSSDPDLDPKRRSRTVLNTHYIELQQPADMSLDLIRNQLAIKG